MYHPTRARKQQAATHTEPRRQMRFARCPAHYDAVRPSLMLEDWWSKMKLCKYFGLVTVSGEEGMGVQPGEGAAFSQMEQTGILSPRLGREVF